MASPPDDRDSPWKEALEHYLEPFLLLLFPGLHAEIDFTRGWVSLDAELQQVVRDADAGRRLADKLFRVWLRSGEEAWVLIHIEVQGQVDPGLGERIFTYRYRIFDRHRRPITNLVVLADDRPDWRPSTYEEAFGGSRLTLVFPTAKLLDWADREAALLADPNPIAVVVLGHLASLRTRGDPQARLRSRWTLVRSLYERFGREDVLELFRFLEWLLALPDELEQELERRVIAMEEERAVPYVTSIERRALVRGRQASVLTALETRFGVVPAEVIERVQSVADEAALDALLRRVLLASTLDEVVASLP